MAQFEHIRGFDDLDRAMAGLPDRMHEKLAVKMASAAAKVIQDEIKARAPVQRGGAVHKRGSKRLRAKFGQPGFLRQHISRKRIERGSNTAVKYAVGPTKAAFYGIFLEFGTKKMAKRPFMRPAIDATKDAAIEKMAAVGRAGLAEIAKG